MGWEPSDAPGWRGIGRNGRYTANDAPQRFDSHPQLMPRDKKTTCADRSSRCHPDLQHRMGECIAVLHPIERALPALEQPQSLAPALAVGALVARAAWLASILVERALRRRNDATREVPTFLVVAT
jgi:hypothetical protein